MAKESTIQIFRSNSTVVPAGLTFGELAVSDVNGVQRLFVGVNNGATGSVWIGAGITDGDITNSSSTLVPTQSAVVTYVSGIVGGGSGLVNTINGTGGAITITGDGGAISNLQSGKANTVRARLASTSLTGVASFSNSNFDVSAGGEVTIKTGGVSNSNLANSSITINTGSGLAGGGSVALGSSITLNNTGVTSINGLTGSITNVARTNQAQTFTGLQQFSAGVSADNLWATNGATFGYVNILSGGISVTGGIAGTILTPGQTNITSVGTLSSVTVTGLATLNGGATANNLWVTNGATFAARSSFNSGLTASHLYVTNGATFASRATFLNGITGSGNIAGFTGIYGNGLATDLLIKANRESGTSSGGRIIIGGDDNAIDLRPENGVVSINKGEKIPTSGGPGGKIEIFSSDLDTNHYTSTIDTGVVTANRTYTLPNITGTLAVVNAAQNFTGVQTFTNGLSASGATFGGGIRVASGGISVTGGIAGSIVTPAQTSITSLGTQTVFNTAGITSSERVTISSGGLNVAGGGAVVNSGGLSVTGGANITGGVAIAGPFTVQGGIPNAQLQNSSISVVGGGSSTLSLGGTLTLTGTANNIIVSNNGTNTLTLSLPPDVIISNNLTVNGSVITANVDTFVVEDPLFMLGTGNANDTVDLGFYAQYMESSGTGRRFTGLFRDASDKKYYLFAGLTGTQEPGTTVNIVGAGFTAATLVARIDGGTF